MAARKSVSIQPGPVFETAPIDKTGYLWKKIYREDALRKQKSNCCYCFEPLTKDTATADHVIPVSKGGTTSRKNIKACCQNCNSSKGNMPEKKFKKLIRNPPKDSTWGILMAHSRYRIWTRMARAQKKIYKCCGMEHE